MKPETRETVSSLPYLCEEMIDSLRRIMADRAAMSRCNSVELENLAVALVSASRAHEALCAMAGLSESRPELQLLADLPTDEDEVHELVAIGGAEALLLLSAVRELHAGRALGRTFFERVRLLRRTKGSAPAVRQQLDELLALQVTSRSDNAFAVQTWLESAAGLLCDMRGENGPAARARATFNPGVAPGAPS